MQTALKAEHITVRFGGVVAVNDVSFTLPQGGILGLIGPNGAGKTTLFNAATGFTPMAQGRVAFFGRDVTRQPAYERARQGMGRTFQIERPYESLTVLENALIPAFLHHRRRAQAEKTAMEALEVVGLVDRAHQPASDLNLARLRRLELAKALATKPKVLFLDEIMAGLNPPALAAMIDLLKGLTASGLSILMVEHIMEAIIKLSDHVLVLASGNLIAEGEPQQVIALPQVVEAYLGTDSE
ncbi:ABC transporter ATP-binding protein [Castellaniella sp.]|uniref:ABC transporter ATP-binding protein n=1 Tax=Castellaniella sp. TaxID=1955812 RepID=UPI003C73EBCD